MPLITLNGKVYTLALTTRGELIAIRQTRSGQWRVVPNYIATKIAAGFYTPALR